MVQTTSIAVFASVALFAASPAFGAVLPNSKPATASTTTTVARASTTSAAATKPNPDASRWDEEKKLVEKLYKLEDYKPSPAAVQNNLKKDDKTKTSSSSASSSSATPTGKLLSGKPVDRLSEKLRLDKLRDEKVHLEEQRERLKMSKLEEEMNRERLTISRLDRERLSFERKPAQKPLARPTGTGVTTLGTGPTPGPLNLNRLANPLGGKPQPPSVTGSTTTQPTALPTGANVMTQAQKQSKEKALVEDLERLMGGSGFTRELEEAQWVRGYDNSENDARDYDEDAYAREFDDEDISAREFDDEDVYAREDLEDLEYALRDLDSDMEDVYSRFDFEGLEDLD